MTARGGRGAVASTSGQRLAISRGRDNGSGMAEGTAPDMLPTTKNGQIEHVGCMAVLSCTCSNKVFQRLTRSLYYGWSVKTDDESFTGLHFVCYVCDHGRW